MVRPLLAYRPEAQVRHAVSLGLRLNRMSVVAGIIKSMTTEQPPKWRGIRTIGGDFQISNISLSIDGDGKVTMGQPHARLRTDMWPFWVEDAIEAACIACQAADQIPPLVAQLDESGELQDQIDRQIDMLMIRELLATMRAITASAFAIDAFYATLKDRRGPHPHDETWRKKRTPRNKRITETFRYHLKINDIGKLHSIKSCVSQVFTFRNWAAHMEVTFRDPVYRADVQSSVDWYFHVFRRENAVNAVKFTVIILNYLVSLLDRGGEALASCKPLADERMRAIVKAYEQAGHLPKFQETEIPPDRTQD